MGAPGRGSPALLGAEEPSPRLDAWDLVAKTRFTFKINKQTNTDVHSQNCGFPARVRLGELRGQVSGASPPTPGVDGT